MGNTAEIAFNKKLIDYINNVEIEYLCVEDYQVLSECFKNAMVPSYEEGECDVVCGDYGIEHFNVTSGFENKKGFKQHRISAENERVFKNETINSNVDEPIFKIYEHDDKHTKRNLINSFDRNFDNHYEKISNYKEKHNKIIFFIDCTIGFYMAFDYMNISSFPIHYDCTILDKICKCDELTGIIFSINRYSSNNYSIFMSLKFIKENIEDLKCNTLGKVIYENMKFGDINFTHRIKDNVVIS